MDIITRIGVHIDAAIMLIQQQSFRKDLLGWKDDLAGNELEFSKRQEVEEIFKNAEDPNEGEKKIKRLKGV